MFAVVRHPDIDSPGICPQGAFELQQALGWYRVSEWRAEPADFHLPDFTDASDLDAPASEPEQEPTKAPAKNKEN